MCICMYAFVYICTCMDNWNIAMYVQLHIIHTMKTKELKHQGQPFLHFPLLPFVGTSIPKNHYVVK